MCTCVISVSNLSMHSSMYVCMYACMYVLYICIVCMCVCVYVCIYVCIGYQSQSKLGNSPNKLALAYCLGDGCRYISHREETRMKFNCRGRRMNGKTPRYGNA